MKKVFFLNGFVAIAIVGMVLSACTDNEPDYGSGTEAKGEVCYCIFGHSVWKYNECTAYF